MSDRLVDAAAVAEVQRILDAAARRLLAARLTVIRSAPRPGATSARSTTARMRARCSSRVRSSQSPVALIGDGGRGRRPVARRARSRAWSRCSRSAVSRSRAAWTSSRPGERFARPRRARARRAASSRSASATPSAIARGAAHPVEQLAARPSTTARSASVGADRHAPRCSRRSAGSGRADRLPLVRSVPTTIRAPQVPQRSTPRRASSRSDFARRPRGERHPLHGLPRRRVDDRRVRVRVDELAEAELAEHDPRREQRLRPVERALDPVLAQVLADLPSRSRRRRAAGTPRRPTRACSGCGSRRPSASRR